MNNIEILEEFIKYFEAEATQRKYRRNISITVGEDDIEAIKNLIQENKELKNKCNELNFKYTAQWVDDNFIPKSKVKELGKQVHSKLDNNAITRGYQIIIDEMFSKLLEKGE